MARGDAIIWEGNLTNTIVALQPASGVEVCVTSILTSAYSTVCFLTRTTNTKLYTLHFGTYTGDRTDTSMNTKIFFTNSNYLNLREGSNSTTDYFISGIVTKA